MKTLIIATTNQGKLKEFKKLFKDLPLEIKSLADYPEIEDIEETGKTFAENALIKAKAVAIATGEWALADDSGLMVEALDGAPGIYSARYSGEDKNDERNNKKLLEELEKKSDDNRQASFFCAIALTDGEQLEEIFEGELKGQILEAPRGENGFGYDPLFFLESFNKTTAELSMEEKNKISHRAIASQKAKEKLILLLNK